MKLTRSHHGLVRWAESLACSVAGIRFYRSSAAVRLWSADKRAVGIASNVEAARIAWQLLNRAVRLCLQLSAS